MKTAQVIKMTGLAATVLCLLILSGCQPPASPTSAPATDTPIPQPSDTPTAAPAPSTPTPELLPTSLTYEEALPYFEYDRTSPLDIRERSSRDEAGVTIRDVNFASPLGDRTPAYLVAPAGNGPFAAILYVHWLGSPKGDRSEFLDEAVEMAGHGVVSFLIQGRVPWTMGTSGDIEADRRLVILQTIELRMALDYLISQPGVDPGRVGFVGHDFGAMYGALLSGIDERISTYVLLTPVPTFYQWYLLMGVRENTDYQAAFSAFEPISYVPHAQVPIFYQFAEEDRYMTQEDANALYAATSGSPTISFYPASHQLQSNEAARLDRIAFLDQQLGLTEP